VITPDMIGLCGGLQNTGSGAEGTIKGSRVLVSTAELSRSIADVYVCRKDFYDAHKDLVTKLVAGYLKGCEEVLALKSAYETRGSPEYMNLLQLTQTIYGKTVIPTPEEAHGLLSDCTFVGHPGNVAFFTEKGRLSGFEAMQKSALDLAVGRGYAKVRCALIPADFDWKSAAFTSYLAKTEAERGERFKAEAVREEIEELTTGGALDQNTIYAFSINFGPNQVEFSAEQYGAEYQRIVELADKYGNAVIAIRGHSDPTQTLATLVKAGMSKGILQRTGTPGDYKYSFKGKVLDLTATEEIVRLIDSGAFDGDADNSPRSTMQAGLNLSLRRAQAVRDSIIAYASGRGLTMDKSQIQPVGVGIREPFVSKPTNIDEAGMNRRVELRLQRRPTEAPAHALDGCCHHCHFAAGILGAGPGRTHPRPRRHRPGCIRLHEGAHEDRQAGQDAGRQGCLVGGSAAPASDHVCRPGLLRRQHRQGPVGVSAGTARRRPAQGGHRTAAARRQHAAGQVYQDRRGSIAGRPGGRVRLWHLSPARRHRR
jgi:outer membrane protein OmpA-like peptidoglycan-associated protein